MKRSLLLLLLTVISASLFAQGPPFIRQSQGPSIKGRISGTVLDSISQAPVEFATIELLDASGQKQITGDITDDKGHFKLTDISNGDYTIQVTYLGYATRTLTGVSLTLEKPDLDLGDIPLAADNIQLTEVTVTGEAALVENKIDKIVYNADKDVSTSGGDASEVLRRVPLLSVDLDGNVSLRGSSNIQMLINGRPSGVFAASIADALKTIPADEIKSVEVITTPGAKYDAEGSAGIINIITKKKNIEGFSGSVNTSVGTRQNSAGLSLSLATGRLGISGNGNAYFSWPRAATQTFYREDITPNYTRVLDQAGQSNSTILGYNGSVSAYYDLNAFNSISSSIRYNGFNNWLDGMANGSLSDTTAREFSRTSLNNRLNNGFDWTSDFRKTFPNSEREFSVAFQLTNSFSNRLIENNQTDVLGNAPDLISRQNNYNDGINAEYTLQADYVHPFSKKIKLETGAKAVIRRIDSDYQFEQYDPALQQFVLNSDFTDVFAYHQDVYAGYLSLNAKVGENYGVVAGARYEHTSIAGDYQSERPSFSNQYDNLLPSLILSRTFKNFSTLKLSFSQRIQRPSLYFINPYQQVEDPFNVTAGNPDLEPERSSQFELSYGTFVKGLSINSAVFYRFTQNVIEGFLQVDPETGISKTTFLNIGQNQSFGLDFFSSVTIKKALTLRAGFNLSTYDASGTINGQSIETQALLFNGNMGGNLTVKKVWKFEMFGFYRAPRQSLQGITPNFSLFSLGLNRDIFDKRGAIGIRVVEPFFKNKQFKSELSGENFYQTSNFSIPFRSYGINFSLRFGKLDFRPPQRSRRSIRNEDLKEGGDNNI
ncbi:MAG: TonB-dependent receptor [Lewinellaceae bacterium]|nr:TonB-dependent receptor [Lewinellaceae bacterium]